jgi:L-ectoine synthase
MIIRNIDTVRSSARNVVTPGWESARLLLKDDGMGFSFHITTMYAGKELHMHYRNHLESVFILKGEGTIEDLGTAEVHALKPGVLYVLNDHDRHVVRPVTDIVAACVFNPPVTGREVHDETGAYPLDVLKLEEAAPDA